VVTSNTAPAPATTPAATAASQEKKKYNVYTQAQKKWGLQIYKGSGQQNYEKTASILRNMAPSEYREVTLWNVWSWVEASAKGTMGGSRQRTACVSQPCLVAMRKAAESAIAGGHCVGSRLLRQIFLTELERFGEVSDGLAFAAPAHHKWGSQPCS
jgi:hypothetical protein